MIRKAIIMSLTVGAVGIAVLWITSSVGDGITLTAESPQRGMVIEFRRGLLGVTLFNVQFSSDSSSPYAKSMLRLRIAMSRLDEKIQRMHDDRSFPSEHFDCHWATDESGLFDTQTIYAVCPSWVVLVVLAAYPAIAFIRGPVRRWRRRGKGLCVRCAYDLTGNVSGVCPECGTEIKKP